MANTIETNITQQGTEAGLGLAPVLEGLAPKEVRIPFGKFFDVFYNCDQDTEIPEETITDLFGDKDPFIIAQQGKIILTGLWSPTDNASVGEAHIVPLYATRGSRGAGGGPIYYGKICFLMLGVGSPIPMLFVLYQAPNQQWYGRKLILE